MKGGVLIRPYSDPSQNLGDYPALKHFFKCNETSGNSISCAKTGIVWTPYELDFNSSLNTVRPNKTYATYQNDGPITNGSWETFNANEYWLHMFVITVREYVDATTVEQKLRVRCRIGPLDSNHMLDPSYNGHKWGTSCRGDLHVALTGDGGNSGWIAAPAVSLDATYYDRTILVYSKIYPYVDDFTTNRYVEVMDEFGVSLGMVSTNPGNGGLVPGNITASPQAGMTGGDFFGAAWFSFTTGFPTDLDIAIKWMTASWVNGNRLIWPGWKRLT